MQNWNKIARSLLKELKQKKNLLKEWVFRLNALRYRELIQYTTYALASTIYKPKPGTRRSNSLYSDVRAMGADEDKHIALFLNPKKNTLPPTRKFSDERVTEGD